MLSVILCPLSARGACVAAPQYHVINILVSMQGGSLGEPNTLLHIVTNTKMALL